MNAADIEIDEEKISISLKKKRTLPIILEVMSKFNSKIYDCLNNLKVEYIGASYS